MTETFFEEIEEDVSDDQVWIWRDWLPVNLTTIIHGEGAAGKSRVLAAILANWHQQQPMPDGSFPEFNPKRIILVNTESNKSEIKSTYTAQGWEQDELQSSLKIMREVIINGIKTSFNIDNPLHIAYLEEGIKQWKPGVVIFDPILEFHTRNTIVDRSMRELILKTSALAARWHTANVCMIHWNKNEKQSNTNRLAGSHQLKDASRSVISVLRDPKTGIRTLNRDKNVGLEPPHLNFRIEEPDGQVVWIDPIPVTEKYGSKVSIAETWLQEILTKHEGSIRVRECCDLAGVVGISRSALFQARSNLKHTVGTYKHFASYKDEEFWELPMPTNNWHVGMLKTHAPGTPGKPLTNFE